MFNERELPQFALVTIYLQLPHYEFPHMLKGLYLCLDYNHNPIARRIVHGEAIGQHRHRRVPENGRKVNLQIGTDPEEEIYYNYTC